MRTPYLCSGFAITLLTALLTTFLAMSMFTAAAAESAGAVSPSTTSATSANSTTTGVAALPQRVKVSYRIYRAGLAIGIVDEEFERTGDRYRIRSNTRTDGALALLFREELTATTEGRVVEKSLIPSTFTSGRKSDTSRNFTARFDWTRALLVRESTGPDSEPESFPLPAGTQDRLSSMYQFMLSPPSTDRITILLTQGKQPERYVYVKQDDSRLQSGANTLATVHYAREVKQGESRAEIWLAKDSHFLPVRAIFTDNKGARLEQVLVSLSVSL